MNETYSSWVRGRLPKYEKPNVELIDNLNPSVIIDQSRLGGMPDRQLVPSAICMPCCVFYFQESVNHQLAHRRIFPLIIPMVCVKPVRQ